MAKRKTDGIQKFIKQIERTASRLKKDLKRFSKNNRLPHNLDELAGELRRSAASVASDIEHYLHDMTAAAKAATSGTAKKRTRKTAKKRSAAAKKTTRKTAKKPARKTAKKRSAVGKKTTRKTAKKATRKTAKKRTRR